MSDKTKKWWRCAGIRAGKTAAQVALSMLTVGQAVIDVNWLNVVSVAAVSAVISILTSIVGGIPEVKENGKEIQKESSSD